MSEERTYYCPNCGGPLKINGDRRAFFCIHCGSKLIQEMDPTINIRKIYVDVAQEHKKDLEVYKKSLAEDEEIRREEYFLERMNKWNLYFRIWLVLMVASVFISGATDSSIMGAVFLFGMIIIPIIKPKKEVIDLDQNPGYRINPVYEIAKEDVSEFGAGLVLFVCVVFGVFGAHRFLVGKHKTGIAYLFTIALFGAGWFYDLYKIMRCEFTDGQGRIIT